MIIPPGTAMGTPVVPEPVKKPMAETVSLEVVWAAAFAARASQYDALQSWQIRCATAHADEAVAALLDAYPRGGQ